MLTFALLVTGPTHAFQLFPGNPSWPGASTSFDVGIDGSPGAPAAPAGEAWNDVFVEAMQRWNDATLFTFDVDENRYRDPCEADNDNGVGFGDTACGNSFGSATLAVTFLYFTRGGGSFVETDILFNNAENWGVYAGAQQPPFFDFRRVATHELGHALGLDHEDSVAAIMNSFASAFEFPQADDIAGAAALYGQCTPTAVDVLPNSSTFGSLDSGDCALADLIGSRGDATFVDQYHVTLATEGFLTVAMQSADVDAFIWLFNADLSTRIATDDDGGGGTDALIAQKLPAGTYVILANTALIQPEFGDYQLRLSFGRPDVAALMTVINMMLEED